MTKDELVQYLRVCADLADGPKDGIAHVAIVPLRQAIELLEPRVEPEAPLQPNSVHCPHCRKPITEVLAVFSGTTENREGKS